MGHKVRDVMTPSPLTLPGTASLVEAAEMMRDNSIGDVLIADGRLHGMITDRDIVTRAVAAGLDPHTTTLADIIVGELITIGPDDDADEAVHLMRTHAIRRLPVVDESGRPIGMVTLGDLAVEMDSRSALADISAAPPNE